MPSKEPMTIRETAIAAARAAGAIQKAHFGTRLHVDVDTQHDVKLEADRLCEQVIVGTIRQAWPDHAILTEAEWRAIHCGHAFGFSNVLLPKLPKKTWSDPAPTQQLMGLILLYNMDLWGGYSHGPSRGAMRKACNTATGAPSSTGAKACTLAHLA